MDIVELIVGNKSYVVGLDDIEKIEENKERFLIYDKENNLKYAVKSNDYLIIYGKGLTKPAEVKKKEVKEFSQDVLQLTEYFIDNLKLNNPKIIIPTSLLKWHTEMDLFIRKDGYTPGEISRLIDFSQSDPFWKGIILSVPKLRQKKDTLIAQWNRKHGALDKLRQIAQRGSGNGSAGSSQSHIFNFDEL